MKKAILLGLLFFALTTTVKAQYANATGDVVIPGSNAWTLHTPDDGRTSLFIAPWVNGSWSWNAQTEFYRNGDVRFLGNIQLGTLYPQTQPGYRLAVQGKIVCQALYVTSPSTWADFVFAPTYQPMSLVRLERYLRLNKHLPAIPSASDVETKGYNLTEMDAKLLQSMEELTLHVIELSKQNARMQHELTTLRARIVRKSTFKKASK